MSDIWLMTLTVCVQDKELIILRGKGKSVKGSVTLQVTVMNPKANHPT